MGYRWIILVVMALATFFVQFHRNSSGVIREDLLQVFTMNATQYSLFSSMYFYPYMIMQLPAGILADTWGVRRTVSAGLAICTLGTLLFSLSKSFFLACISRALIGIGVSAPVVCTQKILAAWFKDREIASIGSLISPIGSLGGLMAQAPLAILVGLAGWRNIFLGLGFATAASALLCILLLRDTPASAGVAAIPEELSHRAAGPGGRDRQPLLQILKGVFVNRNNWPLMLIMPMQMGSYIIFSSTWGVPYLTEVFGLSNVQASTYTTYMMVGMIVSNILIPVLSDRMGRRKPMLILSSVLTVLLWILFAYGSNLIRPVLGATTFLMGFTSATVPILLCLVREYNDRRYIGMSVGVCNAIGMAASAVFPMICGFMMDSAMAEGIAGAALYRRVFLFPVAATLLALAAALFTKESGCTYIYRPQPVQDGQSSP